MTGRFFYRLGMTLGKANSRFRKFKTNQGVPPERAIIDIFFPTRARITCGQPAGLPAFFAKIFENGNFSNREELELKNKALFKRIAGVSSV